MLSHYLLFRRVTSSFGMKKAVLTREPPISTERIFLFGIIAGKTKFLNIFCYIINYNHFRLGIISCFSSSSSTWSILLFELIAIVSYSAALTVFSFAGSSNSSQLVLHFVRSVSLIFFCSNFCLLIRVIIVFKFPSASFTQMYGHKSERPRVGREKRYPKHQHSGHGKYVYSMSFIEFINVLNSRSFK